MTSTQRDIEVSYDVSNEFFRLWLDDRMHYTSASYRRASDGESVAGPAAAAHGQALPEETLEEAQITKSKILYDYAQVTPDTLVLDIGCGWGAYLEYLASRGVKRIHGITLSTAQHEEILSRKLPGVWTKVVDYRDYIPDEKYDALISIEMIDHLCSPAQSREGKAIELYRAYFEKLHAWVKPGAYFGFQAILRNRVPRTRKDLEDLAFTADVIFPGGLNPRLEEIIAAVNPYWEVLQLRTQRESYLKTTAEWLRRLRAHAEPIRQKWGEEVFRDYERYLDTCVRAFTNHWSSDVQIQLRQIP
jgi:cyclopropane-fatty-acyl-phospholipid synthase